MIRFIHTADWQMGAKFSHLGNRASQTRSTRLTTARRITRLAEERRVDFMLIAGDLFEHHAVGSETIEGVVEALAQTRVPAVILPGNHDPVTRGGIWNRRRWEARPDHIRVLTEASAVILDGVALYPCPLTQKRSRRDPTAWIPDEDDHSAQLIRVGVAHGSLDILGKDLNFPIHPERARMARLDYLALGDWHSLYEHDERTFYSGTPEPTAFDERDSGHVLEVEIARPGAVPEVRRHRVNSLTWRTLEHDVSADPELDILSGWVSDLESPETTLLRVHLTGAVDVETTVRTEGMAEELTGRLYHLEVREDLQLTPSGGDSAARFPAGPVAQTGDDLMAIASGRVPSGTGRRFADRDPEVVRRALQLLHAAAMEVQG